MNLANKLTVLRIILIIPFLLCLSVPNYFMSILAFIIFVIASITDYYDGKIARETDTITDFGKMLDPIADKLLTFSFLLTALYYNKLTLIYVVIMLLREIIITKERVELAKIGKGVLAAAKLGKIKTLVLMVTIGISILFNLGYNFNLIIFIPAVILTVLSGLEYHKAYKKQIKEHYYEY